MYGGDQNLMVVGDQTQDMSFIEMAMSFQQ